MLFTINRLYYKRYTDDILIIYDLNKINEQTIVHQIKEVDKNFQFKMSTEEKNTNYLDLSIHRNKPIPVAARSKA